MKIREFISENKEQITELRRSEELGVTLPSKTSEKGVEAVINFLKGKDLSKFGVHFSTVNKVGINPSAFYKEYNPVGIYYHTSDTFVNAYNKGYVNELFGIGYPYIYILEFTTDQIIDLKNATENQYITAYKNFLNMNKEKYFSWLPNENVLSRVIKFIKIKINLLTRAGTASDRLEILANAIIDEIKKSSSRKKGYISNQVWRALGAKILVNPPGFPHGVILDPTSFRIAKKITNLKKSKIK